jgi:hypothetical protein
MKLRAIYMGQLRTAAGRSEEEIELRIDQLGRGSSASSPPTSAMQRART